MRKLGIALKHPALSAEEQVQLMKAHGFEATFLPFNRTDFDCVMPLLTQNGIVCESIHAPWDDIDAIWMDGADGDAQLAMLCDRLESCARYGVPTMVMHPTSVKRKPAISDAGNARFDRLVETADRLGVKIACENIKSVGHLVYLLERYPQMKFCWDVGHEGCFSRGIEFMPFLGDRIGALHLHDNFGVADDDRHLLPFDGALDMERAARQLAKSGYGGSIMLEFASTESFYAHLNANEFYARAAALARKFADRVDLYSEGKK